MEHVRADRSCGMLVSGQAQQAVAGHGRHRGLHLLFLGGCVLIAEATYKQRPFMASWGQFAGTLVVVVLLIVGALQWPRAKAGTATVPHAVVMFLAALMPGSALMVLQQTAEAGLHWTWPACVTAVVAVEACFITFMAVFTRGRVWTDSRASP